MTDQQIAELGGAFSSYLGRYRDCFLQGRTAGHFDNYCRGLLSDLPRKSVEPMALASGTAVRTLQEFLVTANWDHLRARDLLQRHVAQRLPMLPCDRLGTVGVFDETSAVKKGDKTPGVQRQYLGCVGKIDNGIVTVHVGLARGRFQALLDAELYLPRSWDEDRPRCREAGIPDERRYQPKWRIAFDQLLRLDANGVKFDWLTFDEGYGSKVPLLRLLSLVGQRFVAEVPVNFSVRRTSSETPLRADQVLTAQDARGGRRFRIPRQTGPDQWWRAVDVTVRVAGGDYTLVVAINEATAEVKYFLTNATDQPLRLVLLVAFRRATIEHGFRLGKQEAGLMHYEGRHYVGLLRHLILALLVLGFVSIHTDRLRGEKSAGDDGAGVPGTEPALRHAGTSPSRDLSGRACRLRHRLPPAPQRAGCTLTQEAAA
jgi:SRSO17 transposase